MAEYYITREAAIKAVQRYAKDAIDKGRKSLDTVDDTIHICDEIERLPATDDVPVVRCKDCKHCGFCGEATNLAVMGYYGYCSRGER